MLSALRFESTMDAVWNLYARAYNAGDPIAQLLAQLVETLNNMHAERWPRRHFGGPGRG